MSKSHQICIHIWRWTLTEWRMEYSLTLCLLLGHAVVVDFPLKTAHVVLSDSERPLNSSSYFPCDMDMNPKANVIKICLAHLVEWCKILPYNRCNLQFRIKITTKSFNESYFIHCFILVLWAYRKKSYPIDIETFMVRRCHCAQTKNGPYFKYASMHAGTGEEEVCKLDVRAFQAKCKK